MSAQVETHCIPSGWIRKYTYDDGCVRYALELKVWEIDGRITKAEYEALLALEVNK